MARKGTKFVVKRKVIRDAKTGREVWQVSPEGKQCVASYMYITSFTPDERYVFYTGNISGTTQLYRLEIATGETMQMTDGKEIHEFHANIHPNGRDLYYRDGVVYHAVDMLTGEDRVVLDTTKYDWLKSVGEQVMFSKSGKHFSLSFRYAEEKNAIARATCDGSSVEEVYRYAEMTQHVLFCPGDEDLMTFAVHPDYQNKPDLPPAKRARCWLLNARTRQAEPFLVMPPGFRCTHEHWGSSGQRIYFHKKTVPTWMPTWVCSMDRVTREVKEIYRSETLRLGHSGVTRDEKFIVTDSQDPRENPLILVEVATGKAETLCWPNSSVNDQVGHVHPSFSPSGRYVLYTSDSSGVAQVYMVPLR
jgi:oligogalacturonide lyase